MNEIQKYLSENKYKNNGFKEISSNLYPKFISNDDKNLLKLIKRLLIIYKRCHYKLLYKMIHRWEINCFKIKFNIDNELKNELEEPKLEKNPKLFSNIIKEEKNNNKNLVNELKTYEINISESKKKLELIHKKINLIENNIKDLKPTINKNYDEINKKNLEIAKEKNIIEKIKDEHKNMNEIIKNKEILINSINQENINLNEKNIIINQENNDIFEHIMKYRNNLIFLVNQNKYLVFEIQSILGRDAAIKNILQRTNNLRNILEDNKNIFNDSSSIMNTEEKINKSILYNKSIIIKNKNKNKNLSEKLENKYMSKISTFNEKNKKENNDFNKSINIVDEKEKEKRIIKVNNSEKESDIEEKNISKEYLNKDEK